MRESAMYGDAGAHSDMRESAMYGGAGVIRVSMGMYGMAGAHSGMCDVTCAKVLYAA